LLFCPKRFWAFIEVMLLKILIGMFIILLDNIMFMNGFRFQHPC
jgi:hypothetical protein